jgi:excisionase family DNA binding protein
VPSAEPVEEPPPEAAQVAATPVKPSRARKQGVRGVHRAPAVVDSKAEPADKTAQVQWLTTLEAAHYLGKTAKAMQMMRYQHSGPAYQRNGNTVRYKSTDLDAWLATRA